MIRYMTTRLRSCDVWEKIKAFFKKAWGYIAAFAGGIAAVLLVKRGGDTRARADIEQLRAKLQQYTELVRSAGRANQKLTKQLEQLTNEYNELRRRVDECQGDSVKLELLNDDIGRELGRMEGAIAGLRGFLDRNGK